MKIFIKIVKIVAGIYLLICSLLYLFQEKIIFLPEKLDKNYSFKFNQVFEELNLHSRDGKLINGLLFKTLHSKGLVFYLHGNAGSLKSWGEVAETYIALDYDVFIPDYRSYGKSEGNINNQSQLFDDNQMMYNELKKRYNEDKIIVLGYSIGTGLAAQLASVNHPKLLILQAPYYNLSDLMKHRFPLIPTFLLRYPLQTNDYLKNCKMPVVIFHGNEDEIIYYGSSLKLSKQFKKGDTLITLDGQGHNGMTDNDNYKKELSKILAN